jgi:hypothetical protein
MTPLYLCDEILAFVRRDNPRYARHGIGLLVQQRSWLMLARRLCVDRALLPFAFHGFGEATQQHEIRAAIDELQKTHFESIRERSPGEFNGFTLKNARKYPLVAHSTTKTRAAPPCDERPDSELATEDDSGVSESDDSSSDMM